jgi:hypothetical protein
MSSARRALARSRPQVLATRALVARLHPGTKAAREDGPPWFARERRQATLVAATTAAPATHVDEEQDDEHDRG